METTNCLTYKEAMGRISPLYKALNNERLFKVLLRNGLCSIEDVKAYISNGGAIWGIKAIGLSRGKAVLAALGISPAETVNYHTYMMRGYAAKRKAALEKSALYRLIGSNERAYNALQRAGIHTPGQLRQYLKTHANLRGIKGVGVKTDDAIRLRVLRGIALSKSLRAAEKSMPAHEYDTILGQIKSGDLDGAKKGIKGAKRRAEAARVNRF